MELNRQHYLATGLIVLLLGLQFRIVESYTLTAESSQFLAKALKKQNQASSPPLMAVFNVSTPPASQREIKPPRWLGFAMISLGAVLILQSLAMRKPAG
jgi:hypothetical protein